MSFESNSTSFMDVLACALGGSAILFLILSTLPHAGSTAKTKPEKDISLQVSTPTPRKGNESRINTMLFQITHPDCTFKIKPSTDIPANYSLSTLDGISSNGLRQSIVRISTDNIEIEVVNCRGLAPFTIKSIRKLGSKLISMLPPSKKRLTYSNGVWQ